MCVVLQFFFFTTILSQVFSWSLQRVDQSRVIFHNTTITGDQTYCSWIWMDSNRGVWEVSIRVWLSNQAERSKSGYFMYQNVQEGNMFRVSWKQSTRLKWRQHSMAALPNGWWNLTADFGQLGYQKDSTQFFVDGELIKLTPAQQAPSLYDSLLPIGWRAKRQPSRMERQRKRFDILDLFTGDGIFAQLPQLFINIFSFFANLFPPEDDGDSESVMEATEPDAEMVPQSTTMASTTTEMVTQTMKPTESELDMMTQSTKISLEPETMTEASKDMPKLSERLRIG